MSIYQFINYIYTNYNVIMRKENNTIIIQFINSINNVTRRAIGEEITDFLKDKNNQNYDFIPHLQCFDSYRYDPKK